MVKTIYESEYAVMLNALRAKRRAAGLTQNNLAKRMNVSRLFIGRCERGERRIDVIELQAICKALGVDFFEFMIEIQEYQHRR